VSRIKNIRKSVDIKHMYVGLDLHKATINATVMDENVRNFSDSIPLGSDIAIALQHGTGHIGYYLKGTTLPYQTH